MMMTMRLWSVMLTVVVLGSSCCTLAPIEPKEPADFKATAQRSILAADARMELLWADGAFTEGPTLDAQGAVLFTDIPNNRIMRFDPKSGETSVWRENSGSANGLKTSPDGVILVCQGADGGPRQLSAIDANGTLTVIADNIDGKKFNAPNDVDVAPNGDLHFTDPRYTGKEPLELDYEGVFLVRDGKVSVATKELQRPNGIVISHDGKHAFIADNNHFPGGNRTLEKMDVNPDGTLGNKQTLFSFRDDQRGFDGMVLDAEGNIYATAGLGAYAGIYVFSPDGEQLAFIDVPDNPTNCTFGGPDEPNTLYFTAQVITGNTSPMTMGLYRIQVKKMRHSLNP
jgi:sugar lactone lactonase YvrE